MAREDPQGATGHGRTGPVPGLREEARAFFRLSPAERAARCGCFAVRRGDIKERADVGYAADLDMMRERYTHPKFGLVPLGSLTTLVQYGTSERSTTDGGGVPVLRIPNLQADGWDLSDLKYLPLSPEEMAPYRLEKGDILFNRTNGSRELVGKCEVFDFEGDWVFASYLIRLRIDKAQAIPEFITAFLNTYWGRRQVEHVSRQILMSNINTEEIRALRVPLPKPPEQRDLLAALDAARAARRRRLAEAESLLGGLDAFVLDALRLTLPAPDGRSVYAVRLQDVERDRFDPHFHRPEYRELVRRFAKIPHRPLGKLVRLSTEVWSPTESETATFRYIEISSVNTTTGEATAVETPVAEAPSRARMQVRRGDVIVSLTRPHYGAIAAIDASLDGCIASTGFAVLRDALVENLNHSYLWTILRCQVSLMQMQQRSSGGNYPAITEEELERVLIPVPDDATQKKIATEVLRRRDAARHLRKEAAQLWDDAKRRFEEALLGPAK